MAKAPAVPTYPRVEAAMQYARVEAAMQYARDVVAGEIPACKWTIAACKRQLDDLARQDSDAWPFRFDVSKAERVCKFIELLPHFKGKWAGTPIRLGAWQAFILSTVFGWVSKADGTRRFKTAYIEVPRKNGKSTFTSPVGLYMLAADGEGGADCYSAATTRDQARIVWDAAKEMARRSPDLCKTLGLGIQAHNLNVVATASKFESLSAEGDTLDGLNIHFAAVDELHAHKTRAVWDVLVTATGSRVQPLIWAITTAGSNRAGICYEVRTYLTKVLDQVAEDETFFGIIYSIDDGDDWTSEDAWRKANPNYGASVSPEDMARKCAYAMQMPSAANNFLTKHLNVWVNSDSSWMDMRAWDRCADPDLSLDDFAGQPCFIGLDLASKIDLAAKCYVFRKEVDDKPHFYAFWVFYLPEDAAEDGRNSQYSGWARDGRLVLTPGQVLDFEYLKRDLREDVSRFDIQEVDYDPFQATQLSQEMLAEGFPMVEFRPTVLNFSEPMKEWEKLVLEGRFHHNGCPAMAWQVSNVVCHLDAKDNIYPRKERPENKIDGPVATITALARAMLAQAPARSIWETEEATA